AMTVSEDEELSVPELHELVRRSYPYADLSRELLDNVLDMLDGRYPSEQFAELRPRIVWDRVADTIRPRRGARQLAVTNAGTIPDRGLYGVHLPDGRRVGELDEEMVYEARVGQAFRLGSTTWRIEEITRDRVIVTPAPEVPGAIPFWHGDGIGRPYELGAAIGDWRLCVLTPFGGRVHPAWAMAITARLRDERGLDPDAIWSDDGVILHLPDADEAPDADAVLFDPEEVEELVTKELGSTA